MIAIRTHRALRAFAIVIGCFLVLVAAFALIGPGGRTTAQAYAHWLLALPLVLLVWAVAEAAGTWLLSRPFFERLSSAVRVFVLVLIISAIIGVTFAAYQVWSAYAV